MTTSTTLLPPSVDRHQAIRGFSLVWHNPDQFDCDGRQTVCKFIMIASMMALQATMTTTLTSSFDLLQLDGGSRGPYYWNGQETIACQGSVIHQNCLFNEGEVDILYDTAMHHSRENRDDSDMEN